MSETALALFRSVRQDEFTEGVIVDDHVVQGVLYPDFEPKLITGGCNKGKTRPADVIYTDTRRDAVEPGGGTSLFDRRDVFGTKYWHCFELPKGTTIPDSLKIVFTGRNAPYDADPLPDRAGHGPHAGSLFQGRTGKPGPQRGREAVSRFTKVAHGAE